MKRLKLSKCKMSKQHKALAKVLANGTIGFIGGVRFITSHDIVYNKELYSKKRMKKLAKAMCGPLRRGLDYVAIARKDDTVYNDKVYKGRRK